MNDTDLDTLLCEPLPVVADDGFSAKVVIRVERAAWWRERLALFAPVAGTAAIVPFLPGEALTHAALRLSPESRNSGAMPSARARGLPVSVEASARLGLCDYAFAWGEDVPGFEPGKECAIGLGYLGLY